MIYLALAVAIASVYGITAASLRFAEAWDIREYERRSTPKPKTVPLADREERARLSTRLARQGPGSAHKLRALSEPERERELKAHQRAHDSARRQRLGLEEPEQTSAHRLRATLRSIELAREATLKHLREFELAEEEEAAPSEERFRRRSGSGPPG